MKLFKAATNEMAYCKMGMFGFEGSGKTYTATMIMLGLAEFLETKKPCAFVDTETGSDFVLPLFKKAGVKLVTLKSRAFVDVIAAINEAEKECYGLIIDSLTHIWRDLIESYQKKLNRKRLRFQDWNQIKPEWHRYSDRYVNSNLHIIACGRAGWNWNYFEEEDGTMELQKVNTKMKAEGEFTFEPSLVVEMERVPAEKATVGSQWLRRAHILKDRFSDLDGKSFDNPGFEQFAPFFKNLNIGGEHLGIDDSRDSTELFDENGDTEWRRTKKQKEILLEEIEAELVTRFPSHSGKDKQAKLGLIDKVFKTKSWTRIGGMVVEDLQDGLSILRDNLAMLDENNEDLPAVLRDSIEKETTAEPEDHPPTADDVAEWDEVAEVNKQESTKPDDKNRAQYVAYAVAELNQQKSTHGIEKIVDKYPQFKDDDRFLNARQQVEANIRATSQTAQEQL